MKSEFAYNMRRSRNNRVVESDEYETVGGLLFNMMGRVPSEGEHFVANQV